MAEQRFLESERCQHRGTRPTFPPTVLSRSISASSSSTHTPLGLVSGPVLGGRAGSPAGLSQPGIQVPFFFPDHELIQK